MGYRVWVAVAVGLAGLCAPAAGQSAGRNSDRPDPSDYFLPPVSQSSRSRPLDDQPRRAAPRYDDYEDELPPPRPPSGNRVRPVAPTSRDSYDSPPPRRKPTPQPLYDDYDSPPPRRKPAPRYEDEEPPPRTRRAASDERGYDEESPPRSRRQSPPPGDYDDYDSPPPRRKPAAALADPSGDNIRRVSADDLDRSRSTGDDRRDRQSPNIIDYLAGEGSGGRSSRITPASYNGDRHESGLFGQKVSDGFDPLAPAGPDLFKSDHSFDSFVSPVSNPFLFEDPRSLTEIRPIFIYQGVPTAAPLFDGGNLTYIGLQGRLAITDRLSVVIHKLGGIGVNPSNGAFNSGDQFGLAEFWLGPKYTFIRDCEDGRLLAGGLQFQIPLGSSKVFQNTGNLSIVPYATFAQNFFSTGYGSFNGLIGTGYSFSTNNARSDYYYLSTHIDFDVGNGHRFYPLAELNWFYYTTDGNSSTVPFEGRDLINFGSPAKNSNLMTWALGGRMKVTRNTEFGGVFEGPLFGNRDLLLYRFTVDFIWRY